MARRVPAAGASVALVVVVVAFARLIGARDGAAWIAACCAGFAPMFMGLTATLNTTTFEPLVWTTVAYAVARAIVRDDRRALIWGGIVAGLGMEAKYALALWLASLALGVALGPQRRLYARRELWLGVVAAPAIALPSAIWQTAHGWPFAELVRNAGRKDLVVPLPAFLINQVFVLDPLFAPIWLGGLLAPFAYADLRRMRYVSYAFACTAIVIVAGHGKDYYLAAAYPPLFALGAVAAERVVRGTLLRMAYLCAALALASIGAPLALPILAPATLVLYERALHLAPQAQENGDAGDLLPPTFADMLGWHRFADQVGGAYAALPPAERSRTAILVDNYGEAAALDLYGARYGLPPALSGHNQYGLWGRRGQSPRNLLRVQDDPDRLRPYCRTMRIVSVTSARYARAFENGKTIAICLGLHPGLVTIWPSLKHYL